MFQPRGQEKVFAVIRERGLHALFDESGIESANAFCIVGGFFGTVKQWEHFEYIWKPYGKSPGFHAKRFFARDQNGQMVSPYRGWTDEQANSYLSKLLKAISVAKINPIISMVDQKAFFSFTVEERHWLTGGVWKVNHKLRLVGAPNRPYYLPFQQALIDSINESSPQLNIYFTFDEQQVFEAHARQVYQRIKKSAKADDPVLAERMKGIAFESDLDNIGLQASDLLVYAWHEYATRGDRMRDGIRAAFEVFKKKRHGDELVFFTHETMERLLGKKPPTDGRILTHRDGRISEIR